MKIIETKLEKKIYDDVEETEGDSLRIARKGMSFFLIDANDNKITKDYDRILKLNNVTGLRKVKTKDGWFFFSAVINKQVGETFNRLYEFEKDGVALALISKPTDEEFGYKYVLADLRGNVISNEYEAIGQLSEGKRIASIGDDEFELIVEK